MTGGFKKSASRVAIVAAAGLLIGLTPAQAADLGDDCCADLEERVAELEATTVRKGNRKVTVQLSGHVATNALYWDDGNESDLYIVQNVHSTSRWRWKGSAKLGSHISAGYLQEFYILGAHSSGVSQIPIAAEGDDAGSTGDARNVVGQAYWWIKHKHFGQFSMGRRGTTTDNLTLIDLGGTGMVGQDTGNMGGSFRITRNNVDAAVGDSKMNAIFTSIDISRGEVVRYDSPTLMGFKVSAAWGENDVWDVALRFAGEFSGVRVALGVGYYETSDDFSGTSVNSAPTGGSDADNRFLGSVSVWDAATTGLFVSGFWDDGDDGNVAGADTLRYGVRGGWRGNLLPIGTTSLFVDWQYGETENTTLTIGGVASANATHSGEQWGFGVVQRISPLAMQFYARYKNLSYDIKGIAGENDQQFVVAGARINF